MSRVSSAGDYIIHEIIHDRPPFLKTRRVLWLSCLLACICVLGVVIPTISHATDSYTVNSGATTDIDEFSNCKAITNNHASGNSIMVPTKTDPEWQSFYNNLPAGVTQGACSGGGGSPGSEGLYSWGSGLLGNGTYWSTEAEPFQISTDMDWTAGALGDAHSCAILEGKMYCWGAGSNGKLGLGSTSDAQSPTQAGVSTGWTDVAAGFSHTCGIDAGKMYCWGSNTGGRTGLGTTSGTQNTPAQVGTDTTWTDIAVRDASCGINGGKLYCWGSGYTSSPVQQGSDTDWSSIVVGGTVSCGIRSGGLYCWGGAYGGTAAAPIHEGTATDWSVISSNTGSNRLYGIRSGALYYWVGGSGSPTQVGTDTDWTDVSIGNNNAFGIRGGALYKTIDTTPTQVGTFTNWSKVYTSNATFFMGIVGGGGGGVGGDGGSCGAITSGYSRTCAIGSDDKAYCWGRNDSGQLGDGSSSIRTTPTLVLDGESPGAFKMLVTTGDYHTCGIGSDDKAYCWGANTNNQLGDTTTSSRSTPVLVVNGAGPGTYKSITEGSIHTCGIGTDDKAYCWGANNQGQLGNNAYVNSGSPVLVVNGASPGTWKALAAGNGFTCGIGTDDKAYCWGLNNNGQMGDNTTAGKPLPTLVVNGAGPGTYKAIDLGNAFTCAIGTDDKAYCWGVNSNGQLGDTSTSQRNLPTLVVNGAGPGTYKSINGGWNHVCAVGSDDKAYCWGYNYYGMVGDNTTVQKTSPTTVLNGAGPGTYTSVTAADYHSCGRGTDDKLYCWGFNATSQLGDSTVTQRNTPVLVLNGAGPGTYATCDAGGGGGGDACETGPIGTACADGAVYAGTLSGTRLYAAPADESGTFLWKTSNTATAGTTSTTDGSANTDAMAVAGLAAHPAGQACRNRGSEWYLPALDELNVLYANHSGVGGFDVVDSYYWSSTEYSSNGARLQGFADGTQSFVSKNTTSYTMLVRCVRR